jgi:hypothetical protein
MSKHTHGPWLHGGQQLGTLKDEITDSVGGRLIAAVFVREFANTNDERGACIAAWPEGEANASLIVAAPDLLALAHQYASECGDCAGTRLCPDDEPCMECSDIWAVIDKAEGRKPWG